MQPISLFTGLLILIGWGVVLAVGIWPPLALALGIAAAFGLLELDRRRIRRATAVGTLDAKFRDSDDTLLRDCLGALEGRRWLTGTAAFERFLQLATTDRWLGIDPAVACMAYRQLAADTATPLHLVLAQDGEVTTPRRAHELARAAMMRLAQDAATRQLVEAWQQRKEAAVEASAAGHATPDETTAALAGAGGAVLALFLFFIISVPPLAFLLGTDATAGMVAAAPVFLGYLQSRMVMLEPGYLGPLMALVGAGLVGWGVFRLLARRQDARRPLPLNNRLLVAAMAGSAAFLVVQPPATHEVATTRLCSAIQDGFGLAADEGPAARRAASDAYRSLCLPGAGPMLLPMDRGMSRLSDATRNPPTLVPWEERFPQQRLEPVSPFAPRLAAPSSRAIQEVPTTPQQRGWGEQSRSMTAPLPEAQPMRPRLAELPPDLAPPSSGGAPRWDMFEGRTDEGRLVTAAQPQLSARPPRVVSLRETEDRLHWAQVEQALAEQQLQVMNLEMQSYRAAGSNMAADAMQANIELATQQQRRLQETLRLLERQQQDELAENARRQRLLDQAPSAEPEAPLLAHQRVEAHPTPGHAVARLPTTQDIEARLREFQRTVPPSMHPAD